LQANAGAVVPPPDMVSFQPFPSSSAGLLGLTTTCAGRTKLAVVRFDHFVGYFPPLFAKNTELADVAAPASAWHAAVAAICVTLPNPTLALPSAPLWLAALVFVMRFPLVESLPVMESTPTTAIAANPPSTTMSKSRLASDAPRASGALPDGRASTRSRNADARPQR
jgi:hypothetical protein